MEPMSHEKRAALPIGIFDSGVGGLTVLDAIHKALPHEDLLYLGDTARLPYGTKSQETVATYAQQATAKLVERGIKMLVVACNTATSAALPKLREVFAPLPVLGVIEPGAQAAVSHSRNGHIVVIATESTIKGGAYHKAITALRSDVRITEKACMLFVHLAEEGWVDGPLVEGIAERYLKHIFAPAAEYAPLHTRPDTLLLGCTHFPLLRPALIKVVGEDVAIVDSAHTAACAVQKALTAQNLHTKALRGHCHFMTTDDVARFAEVGSIFLGLNLEKNRVEHIDL